MTPEPIPVGTPVFLRRAACRVLAYEARTRHRGWGDERETSFSRFGHVGQAERNRYEHQEFWTPEPDDRWPGLAVPVSQAPPKHPDAFEKEPDDAGHVRIRRVPAQDWLAGVVLGQVNRHEGRRHSGGYGLDGDTPGYLLTERIVPLYEVALLRPGKKALIHLAWHADIGERDA